MAEVVVDRLLGGEATFPGADTSTKLKLLGVDVASFGDAFAEAPGSLEVVYADPVAKVYKKLVLSDDATTLLGGVLVGDASAYASLRPMLGRRARLRTRTPGCCPRAASRRRPASCPTRRTSAPATTSPPARSARPSATQGCTDLGAVKACTKAGTSCGSCLPLVKNLLNAELKKAGAEVSTALCEHFAFSRAQLFDIVSVTGLRTFSEIIAAHGTGRGCDICRPVVASILSSLGAGHVLDKDLARLQDTNDHVMANLQKDGTYSVVPRVPGGEITPAGLIAIGRGGPGLRAVHQDHRRAADRPVRRPPRAAAGDLEATGRGRVRVRARLRQGAAHGEVLRRLDLVPLRRAGLGRAWPSSSSCATAGCARRTRSSSASPGARGSARRRAARTSA